MKIKIINLVMVLILSITIFVGCTTNNDKVGIEATKYEGEIVFPEGMQDVHALYNDPSENIESMKKTTGNIILGEVIDIEEVSQFAVRTSVKVIDSYKGNLNKDNIIYISQVGTPESNEVLVKGNQYILFVNLNEGTKDSYYIRAGIEGIFDISKDTGLISPKIEKWKLDLSKTFQQKNNDIKIKLDDFEKYLKSN